jgi:anti-sigma B factor antagonist
MTHQDVARPATRRPQELLTVAVPRIGAHGRVTVEVVGEVDHFTAPLLSACLDTHVARGGLRELVVDMDGVTFLGAAGLAILARADLRCRERGARFRVRPQGRAAVRRPLELAGLTHLLDDPWRTGGGRRTAPRPGGRPGDPRTTSPSAIDGDGGGGGGGGWRSSGEGRGRYRADSDPCRCGPADEPPPIRVARVGAARGWRAPARRSSQRT